MVRPAEELGMRPLYPVRCPGCRDRLTCRTWLKPWVRWCVRCRQTVCYVGQVDRLLSGYSSPGASIPLPVVFES